MKSGVASGRYYGEEAHHSELRINLPAGSYAPAYSRQHGVPAMPAAPGIPELPPTTRGRARVWAAGAALAALVTIGIATLLVTKQQSGAAATTFDRFWAPLLSAPAPVLLCPGGLDMYELPANVKQAANAAAAARTDPPLLSLSPRQVQRVGARYVAIADAVAIARIAALFQQRGHPYQIREHNLTSFADLRASPAVLIGMFSNAWTLQLGSGFRFVPTIEGDGHHVGIIDRQIPIARGGSPGRGRHSTCRATTHWFRGSSIRLRELSWSRPAALLRTGPRQPASS